jgi:hypothetical protein
MFIKEEVKDSESQIDKETRRYMGEIDSALFLMLKNPTEKEIKRFRDIRDALLVGWFAAITGETKQSFYTATQIGIDSADKQLAQKSIKDVVEKEIDKKTFVDKIDARQTSLEADLAAITESIKANSEKIIREIKSKSVAGTIEEQKKISTELVADLQDKGITFFTDKIGRKTPIEKYIKMRVMTDTVSLERSAFFTRAFQFGVDLVRIVHLNLHPTCELCAPFENKILSITGRTSGYMTIDMASLHGLFHPNCDHVPEELELAPEDKGGEGVIGLNEANKKRFAYNKKKSMI